MSDIPRTPRSDPGAPDSWHEAFAALPPETPPADGWGRLTVALDAQHRHRQSRARRPATRPRRGSRLAWLASAAALLLAIALPWRLLHAPADSADPVATAASSTQAAATPVAGGRSLATTTALPAMSALYAESAQLEALLAYARDQRMASATAIALADELDTRIAAIDSALAQPGLDSEREHLLWHERVLALRALVSFESSRRWLAARGERYEVVLVRVD